jgi:hypothetical protein
VGVLGKREKKRWKMGYEMGDRSRSKCLER